jgi:hypothetical protein
MNEINNYFTKLSKIQFDKRTEATSKEINGKIFDYLNWAVAWSKLKENFPDSTYEVHEDKDGNPYFLSTVGCFVKVSVTVRGIMHKMQLPVLDGANKAQKAQSYEYQTKYGKKTCEALDAQEINNTIMRCLVKAIAMHGEGLYFYSKQSLAATVQDKPEPIQGSLNTKQDVSNKINEIKSYGNPQITPKATIINKQQ